MCACLFGNVEIRTSMLKHGLPMITDTELHMVLNTGSVGEIYDFFVQPIHQALYAAKSFDMLDERTGGCKLLVYFDYLRMHVTQGGFIQFIHNGYVGLLPETITLLKAFGIIEMSKLLDDVLKVFVLNFKLFEQAHSVSEFAKLYDELKEFEMLDSRFNILSQVTEQVLVEYAAANTHEFFNVLEN